LFVKQAVSCSGKQGHAPARREARPRLRSARPLSSCPLSGGDGRTRKTERECGLPGGRMATIGHGSLPVHLLSIVISFSLPLMANIKHGSLPHFVLISPHFISCYLVSSCHLIPSSPHPHFPSSHFISSLCHLILMPSHLASSLPRFPSFPFLFISLPLHLISSHLTPDVAALCGWPSCKLHHQSVCAVVLLAAASSGQDGLLAHPGQCSCHASKLVRL